MLVLVLVLGVWCPMCADAPPATTCSASLVQLAAAVVVVLLLLLLVVVMVDVTFFAEFGRCFWMGLGCYSG